MTRRRDRGQATVELALCLPVLCLMLLAIVQVAAIGGASSAVQAAAREGARAAAVSATPDVAARLAVANALPGRAATVAVASRGTLVTVTVTLAVPTDAPLIGTLLPTVDVTASATMALEPP